jgi:hypothetical protein
LPPGLPGGEITGILPVSGAGVRMPWSIFDGGQITPLDWLSLSLRFCPDELVLLAQFFVSGAGVCACAANELKANAKAAPATRAIGLIER